MCRTFVVGCSLLITSLVHAQAAVSLTVDECAGVLDVASLREHLQIELQSESAVHVACAPDASVFVDIAGRPRETFALGDVAKAARPRTLALAIAELARQRPGESEDVTPPPKTPPVSTAPSAGPKPAVTTTNKRRLYGGLSIGLLSFTVAGFAVGAPITVIGETAGPSYDSWRIGGSVVMGVSAAAFVASAVTFGLWLRERRR